MPPEPAWVTLPNLDPDEDHGDTVKSPRWPVLEQRHHHPHPHHHHHHHHQLPPQQQHQQQDQQDWRHQGRFHLLLNELLVEYERVACGSESQPNFDTGVCFPLYPQSPVGGVGGMSGGSSASMLRTGSLGVRSDQTEPFTPSRIRRSFVEGGAPGSTLQFAGASTLNVELTAAERRWGHLSVRILEVHSSDHHTLRECWLPPSIKSGSMAQLPAAGTEKGQDVVTSLWSRKASFFRAGSRLNLTNKRRGWIMHPDAVERLLWAMLGLAFINFDILLLTLSVFNIEGLSGLALYDCIYWSIDVAFNFMVGFHEHDKVVLQPSRVAKRYLKTWFLFDFVLSCATWVLLYINRLQRGTSFIRYFRMVRLVRLFRLSKFSMMLRQLVLRIQFQWLRLGLRVGGYMFAVAFWIHINATLFYWIGDKEGGWTRALEEYQTVPLNYVMAVHWAASQLQGGIDVYPALTVEERTFAVLSLLASVAILAMVVSKVTTILQAMQMANRERHKLFTTARRFVEMNNVTPKVSLEVYRYITLRQRSQAREQQEGHVHQLLIRLPWQLKRRLLEEARWPVLRKQLVFASLTYCSAHFKKQLLCDVLQTVVHPPDDLVFQYGSFCPRMYITVTPGGHYTRYARLFADLLSGGLGSGLGTNSGILAASDDGDEANKSNSTVADLENLEERHRQLQGITIAPAMSLCEPALWTRWVHSGDFEAVGELELFTINIQNFIDLVMNCAAVQKSMRVHASRFVNYLNSSEDYSDLLSTEHVMAAIQPTRSGSTVKGTTTAASWSRAPGNGSKVSESFPQTDIEADFVESSRGSLQ